MAKTVVDKLATYQEDLSQEDKDIFVYELSEPIEGNSFVVIFPSYAPRFRGTMAMVAVGIDEAAYGLFGNGLFLRTFADLEDCAQIFNMLGYKTVGGNK